jgi:integrase
MGRGPDTTGLEVREDSIRLSFYWRNRRCRETLRLAPTTANLTYAGRLRSEILRKIELGSFRYGDYFPDSPLANEGAPAVKTFKEVAEAWMAAGELAKSTKHGYRKILEGQLYPEIGDAPIASLTYLKLTELLSDDGWSKKRRNNVLICIRRPFDIAHIDGLIQSNPAARLRYLRAQVPSPDPFEPAEADAIVAEIERRFGSQVGNYCGVGFFVGSRPSEQIAFQWEDIDWRSKTLRISRARVLQEEKGTKTGQARDHELSGRALQYLEAQRSHTQLRSPSVFLDPATGKLYNDDKPFRERYWRPTLKGLKIRYREPYQMRHTYATVAIMAGANPVWVARQMGNSPRVVFKHYARWIERMDRSRELAKVNEFLGRKWDETEGNSGGSAGE